MKEGGGLWGLRIHNTLSLQNHAVVLKQQNTLFKYQRI